MRKLIVAEFVSLDGFIAKENGQMDFFTHFQQDRNMMIEAQQDWDLLLMGRHTYELMVQFWPHNQDDKDPIAKYMNHVDKIVISSTLKKATWGTYREPEIVKNNIPERIRQLKKQQGKNIALLGSAITANYLMEQALVDEYFLLIYPILIGKGKPLFNMPPTTQMVALIENQMAGKGILQLKYAVPGK
jgi:dihydrofolate reductase